jgi:hypothetical protein
MERILPEEEWPRLPGEAAKAWETFGPETRVFVVEDRGEIVATWAAIPTVHMECLWVKPSHRGLAGVVLRLFRGLREIAAEFGVAGVVTSSLSPTVTDLIRRFGGTPLPGEMFVLPIEIARPAKRAGEEACLPQ